ncbi:hypothetical protein M2281_005148 [Mesorhizobium soli]|nr:hypothetical protein [Mesorhizobium soli]
MFSQTVKQGKSINRDRLKTVVAEFNTMLDLLPLASCADRCGHHLSAMHDDLSCNAKGL